MPPQVPGFVGCIEPDKLCAHKPAGGTGRVTISRKHAFFDPDNREVSCEQPELTPRLGGPDTLLSGAPQSSCPYGPRQGTVWATRERETVRGGAWDGTWKGDCLKKNGD